MPSSLNKLLSKFSFLLEGLRLSFTKASLIWSLTFLGLVLSAPSYAAFLWLRLYYLSALRNKRKI